MLRLPDRWVWDFWTVFDGERWHLFHLQAPRTLHPDERHWHASIDHATSVDLSTWEHHGTVLTQGHAGEWDETATWTGSVIRHDSGRWLMAYTGISRTGGTEPIATERIGLAWSDDLHTWTKDERNPVLVSEPRWYEPPGTTSWQHGWRDPFLFSDDDGYHMLISARTHEPADPFRRGAIAHATSADGYDWMVGPPIDGTCGRLAQLEVPHLVTVGDTTHLIVSTNTDGPWPRDDGDATTLIGTAALTTDRPLGPYTGEIEFVDADQTGSRYAGRIIEAPGMAASGLVFMSFLDGPADAFPGVIADPLPVDIVDGRLRVGRP